MEFAFVIKKRYDTRNFYKKIKMCEKFKNCFRTFSDSLAAKCNNKIL